MSKKKTHEEYVAELKIKNPTIDVVEEYVDAKTKITHHCLIHDVYWEITPSGALSGSGCEMCRREKISNFHYKTNDEYINELESVNPDISVLEVYAGAKIPILHKCLIHNIEWKIAPSNVLNGEGCRECKSDKIKNKLRKNSEQYVEELKIINPNIVPVEKYVDYYTPILHECLIDGYKWMAKPVNILHGSGCHKCSNRIRRSHDEYVYEVAVINPNIEVIGIYTNMVTKVLHKCKIHNVEWEALPYNILEGHGCRECGNDKSREKNSKSHEQYIEELKYINPDIVVVGTYINSFVPILHQCLVDGCEWLSRPANILSGCGCPQCSESTGERSVRQWLNKNGFHYIPQNIFSDCKDINPLPFDFYLPKFNLCIEFDGEQHYKPIDFFGGQEKYEYTVRHDKIKDDYCEKNNIRLLRIPYFKNIEEELNNFLFI